MDIDGSGGIIKAKASPSVNLCEVDHVYPATSISCLSDTSAAGIEAKQRQGRLRGIADQGNDYSDILRRNLEETTQSALDALRLKINDSFRFDRYTQTQRIWLEQELREWCFSQLPQLLTQSETAIALKTQTICTDLERSFSAELLGSELENFSSGIKQAAVDHTATWKATVHDSLKRICWGKVETHIANTESNTGFSLKADTNNYGSGANKPVPIEICQSLLIQFSQSLDTYAREIEKEVGHSATEQTRCRMEALLAFDYTPRFTSEMKKAGTNDNAVSEAVDAIVRRCRNALSEVRSDVNALFGSSELATEEPIKRADGYTSIQLKAFNTQQRSMRVLVEQWRAVIEDSWLARLNKLDDLRHANRPASSIKKSERIAASTELLKKFAVMSGEPLIVLPPSIDALSSTIDQVGALRYIGGEQSDFCFFLEYSDLEVLLSPSFTPLPRTAFWEDLESRFARLRGKSFRNAQIEAKDQPLLKAFEDKSDVIRRWQLGSEAPATRLPKRENNTTHLKGQTQRGNAFLAPETLGFGADHLEYLESPANLGRGYSQRELKSLQELRRLRQRDALPLTVRAGRDLFSPSRGVRVLSLPKTHSPARRADRLSPARGLQRIIELDDNAGGDSPSPQLYAPSPIPRIPQE